MCVCVCVGVCEKTYAYIYTYTYIIAYFTFLQNIRLIQFNTSIYWGHAVAQLVEVLRYKPEGRGFDSPWCHWIFSLT